MAKTINLSQIDPINTKRLHTECVRVWNQFYCQTADSWYFEQISTNDYQTGNLFIGTLTGSPLNNDTTWRGRPVDFENAKVKRAWLDFKVATDTMATGLTVLIVSKEMTNGSGAYTNLQTISNTVVSSSLTSGFRYRQMLTINAHTAFNLNTKWLWAVKKNAGSSASATITEVNFIIEFEEA